MRSKLSLLIWFVYILTLLLADQASSSTIDNDVLPIFTSELSSNAYKELDIDTVANDMEVWTAINDSINKWQVRKLRKLARRKSPSRWKRKHRLMKRDEEIVCYNNLGCFRDEGAFDYLDTLPAHPDLINTTFSLYTRRNLDHGEILDHSNSTSRLKMVNFDRKQATKVIIHGFGSSGKNPWVLRMVDALLRAENTNVIVVDWGNGAALPNYVQAAANTQLVGKQLANLIKKLGIYKKTESNDIHLIGFSLGAHVAGFAGNEITNISRITGLDPASPLFEGYSERVRLDSSDAEFVDVIHSNGDSFLRGGLGSFNPMGHVDFYPNGGRSQVGCDSVLVGAISDIFYGQWKSLCHHRRAFKFFIDSVIATCNFHAFSCESYEKFLRGECFGHCDSKSENCSNMGYFANQSPARGSMYLVTRQEEPFCANQYKLQLVNSNDQTSTFGTIEVTLFNENGNETFKLTSDTSEIKANGTIQGLVVAHPIIRNISHVIIKYTKYRGWIYSGLEQWKIDRLTLINSHGEQLSYCGLNTALNDVESVTLPLVNGDCSVEKTSSTGSRIGRYMWNLMNGRKSGKVLNVETSNHIPQYSASSASATRSMFDNYVRLIWPSRRF